jgi:uncharacterized protein
MGKIKFDCMKCVGICCSVYDQVEVNKRDIKRLAKYFKVEVNKVIKRYTKVIKNTRILRRKKDPLLGETCIFHDLEKRVCGIYEGRPEVCRIWPTHGDGSCVYYNLIEFERRQQGDTQIIPLIQLTTRQ